MKTTDEILFNALIALYQADRDYDRYGSEDDWAVRQKCLDDAASLIAKCERQNKKETA